MFVYDCLRIGTWGGWGGEGRGGEGKGGMGGGRGERRGEGRGKAASRSVRIQWEREREQDRATDKERTRQRQQENRNTAQWSNHAGRRDMERRQQTRRGQNGEESGGCWRMMESLDSPLCFEHPARQERLLKPGSYEIRFQLVIISDNKRPERSVTTIVANVSRLR